MTAHAVHLEPEYRTERHKTFDPARAGDFTPEADGWDVVPEERRVAYNPVTDRDEFYVVPEVRTPWSWTAEESMRIDQPTECPDCTRGLYARDDAPGFGPFLHCVRIDDVNWCPPCHTGCLVACGETRDAPWPRPEPVEPEPAEPEPVEA